MIRRINRNAGKVDISAVRRSITIADAAKAVGIDQKYFYQLFKIPEPVSAYTKMKDIGNVVAGYDS